MDYKKIYDQFIFDRLLKQPDRSGFVSDEYYERHHIVPRCLGGSDHPSNLVILTCRDHIHAHLLLGKIHGGFLLAAAFFMTKRSVGKNNRLRPPTKKEYALLITSKKAYVKFLLSDANPKRGVSPPKEVREKLSKIHSARAKAGLMWAQQHPDRYRGDNHWTKKASEEQLASLKSISINNLKKASEANRGPNNPMHRPEVKAKLRAAQLEHRKNGTGAASKEALAKAAAGKRTQEYIEKARSRVLGELNPSFGKSGGANPNSRKVLCVDLNMVFDSVTEAMRFCKGDVRGACARGGRAGGYRWARLDRHPLDGPVNG